MGWEKGTFLVTVALLILDLLRFFQDPPSDNRK